MRIDKIKFNANDSISIDWSTAVGDKWESHKDTFHDAPLDSFGNTLQKLIPYVVKNCSLQPKVKESLKVTGATYSYKKETSCRVIVTATHPVADANSPANPATPSRTLFSESNNTDDQIDDKTIKIFSDLINEAEMYLDGKRKQPELTDQETDEDEEDEA